MESIASISLTARQRSLLVCIGLATVLVVGIAGCLLLMLALLWLAVHLALLTLMAFTLTLSALGATYAAASPPIQFLVLFALGYVLYRLYRQHAKGRQL